MKEENYTEQYKGVIMLRKGQMNDAEIWFATVGNQLVSDGVYKTKEELVENLENLSLERVCKMISGAFGRAIELSANKLSAKNKEQ